MSDEERVVRLEEKVAYLERHVTAQDKAMLELSDDLTRLRAELRILRARGEGEGTGAADQSGEVEDEQPPHY